MSEDVLGRKGVASRVGLRGSEARMLEGLQGSWGLEHVVEFPRFNGLNRPGFDGDPRV